MLIHLYGVMIAILFSVGIAGLLGMTWFFPLVGRIMARSSFPRVGSREDLPVPVKSIAVLIPAHNEETAIGPTIKSIQIAIESLSRVFPEVKCSLVVGADGCSDRTAALAHEYGASVIEFRPNKGKWYTVLGMVETYRDADWIILADSGILWPDNLLTRLLSVASSCPSIMGVAPCYRNPTDGPVERFLWSLESHFKGLESASGGPVSIHGATIMYRAQELLGALHSLSTSSWLNDDVVVPLYLRALHPEKEIRYLTDVGVIDQPGKPARVNAASFQGEFGRRKRMMLGNVQWIRAPWWKHNRLVFALALRRIFRLFWAYWSLITVVAAGLYVSHFLQLMGESVTKTIFVIMSLLCLTLLFYSFKGSSSIARTLRRLIDSACASLLAPWYLLTDVRAERAGWK
jgi:glycosyltransferase involved in cell wall biosynthesis